MITLGNCLQAQDIRLQLESRDVNAATVELANLLRHDRRITDWSRFLSVLEAQEPVLAGDPPLGFCIPHARTEAVQSLVMAAGHSKAGLALPDRTERCHYLFVVGIPSAMAADYLRIIGALARIFKSPKTVEALENSNSAKEFHDRLAAAEVAL